MLELTLDTIADAVGTETGPTDWVTIDQDRIDAFAETTEDHQWIHVDPQRAKDGPFGQTIAHGLLTLALLPTFIHQLIDVTGQKMTLNYGFDKVRFPSPVPSGSRVRATGRITDVTELDGAVQVVFTVSLMVEGSDKPCCVAESVARHIR